MPPLIHNGPGLSKITPPSTYFATIIVNGVQMRVKRTPKRPRKPSSQSDPPPKRIPYGPIELIDLTVDELTFSATDEPKKPEDPFADWNIQCKDVPPLDQEVIAITPEFCTDLKRKVEAGESMIGETEPWSSDAWFEGRDVSEELDFECKEKLEDMEELKPNYDSMCTFYGDRAYDVGSPLND